MHFAARFAVCAVVVLGWCSTMPLNDAAAHGGRKITCAQTAADAITADIQAMPDGEAKTTATREVNLAEQMMAENNMEACADHMHKAMDAIEE